jgi:mono/diheme cytochrome c family protein
MRYKLLILLIFLGHQLVRSQDWDVPQDRSEILATFEFTDSVRTAGEGIYLLNCKSCHGDPGKGNYQALNPIPGDPASDKIQVNSDGALYYKISEGRGLMPSFKRILSPDDIWSVISYIRSFNPGYTQAVSMASQLSNMKWSEIKILVDLVEEDHKLIARLTGLEGDKWTPVPGTELSLTAKRYFGMIALDNPKISDEKGMAIFEVPDDLPGDSLGLVQLTVKLTDIELFGDIKKDTVLNIGTATLLPPLNSQRAMWNINRKAPVWLILAYTGVVLTVWGFIFYVLFRLRAIHKEGEDEE